MSDINLTSPTRLLHYRNPLRPRCCKPCDDANFHPHPPPPPLAQQRSLAGPERGGEGERRRNPQSLTHRLPVAANMKCFGNRYQIIAMMMMQAFRTAEAATLIKQGLGSRSTPLNNTFQNTIRTCYKQNAGMGVLYRQINRRL